MTATPSVQLVPHDEFNQALIENAHPPGWVNPKPSGRYNLVVIGAGTAGLVSAAGAALLGARVALVERHLMGGDCLNYGCVPSKTLIRSARAAYAVREAEEFGIAARVEQIEFAKIMRRVRMVRAEIAPHDSAERFRGFGADVYLGQARFVDDHTVEVAGERLQFSKAIIATGARAASLPLPGLDQVGFLTNETIFSLTELPRRLLVIGAGPVGCELAQSFARLGCEVSLLSGGPLLPREEGNAADVLERQFRREQIAMHLGVKIQRAEMSSQGKTLIFDSGHGVERISGDEILVAVGRAPNVEGLNLEAAGVKYESKGVIVDDHLRTSNPHVYAAGDIASPYHFTHAAEALGRMALQNALFFGRKRASDLVIPWCTYTDPEVAHVGMYEKDAHASGLDTETFTLPFREIDRAVTDGEVDGFARALVNRKNGRLLGATLVGRHAGESIGELTMAIQRRMKVGDLGAVIHPYPTEAEAIKRVGDLAMRARLKPWMKRLLIKFFAWRR